MKRSCKTYFLTFISAIVGLAALYVLVVTWCGRGYSGDQRWFLDFHPLKRHFAAEKSSPKIILYGGSSSFYGIDGKELHQYTGLDNINLSSSILMPMRFYLADLERYVNEGDVVVLPLEQNKHFCEGAEVLYSEFGIACLLGTLPEAKRYLSGAELFSLYAHYGFSWLVKSVFQADAPLGRMCLGDSRQGWFEGLHSEAYVAEQWARAARGEIPKVGHPWEMSPYGDWLRDLPTRSLEIANPGISEEITDEFLKSYHLIEALVKKRHAQLLVVWTPQYFYVEQTGREEFQQKLATQYGIEINGRPESVALPKSVYFDPLYHINREGAKLWTRELAKTICAATGRPFRDRQDAGPMVVFADRPQSHFPGVSRLEQYESGVRVHQKNFPLEVQLPAALRGKDLEASLVLKPSAACQRVIAEIKCDGEPLIFDEQCFRLRSESRILVPSKHTQKATLRLEFNLTSETVGLERLYLSKAAGGAAKFFGRYSVAQDRELVRLGKGFSTMEPWGCWTDGEVADLELVVPPQCQGKDFRLAIEAYTFVTGGHPTCEFAFESAGECLANFASQQFEYSFSLAVPARLVKEGVLPLTIRVKAPVSSVQLGKGTDPRRLGVGLKSIRFENAPDGGSTSRRTAMIEL